MSPIRLYEVRMPNDPPPADQFWLLVGRVPAGPFTAAQIRDRLATGEVTYGTKVCPVGEAGWQPLHRLPGLTPDGPPLPLPETRRSPAADPRREQDAADVQAGLGSVPVPGRHRRFRYALLGAAVLVTLGLAYTAVRRWLPDALAGYERGYADTVLRYADRSYEGAKWTRFKESASLAALAGAGDDSAAGLWRVAGWDADNLWVANEYGLLFHLRDGHWRYAGRPAHARYPRLRVFDPDTALVAGCGHARHLYRVAAAGTTDLGDLGWTNDDHHTEVFPADRDLVVCYPDEAPHLNPGAVRFADGVRTVLREDGFKEAFVHDPDNTPLKDHPVRFLRFTRSHRAGAGYAVSPASTGGVVWGKRKLVRFDAGTWYAVADLPDREPRDVWVTGPAADPVVVLVGANGWVHVRPAGTMPGADRTPAAPPEPTSMTLIKVWGASPDKFWVMDEAGTVWEFAGAESRVVVRGLRRDDVAFRDAWVSPTGAVFAITDKHLYRLD